ncbi:MAG: anthranilate phosphoribosyltransferase [Planctomycetaceae bacterium]|nr:anthranilate phosphoribosyltransferase [Planctomycetaceae bacterium]
MIKPIVARVQRGESLTMDEMSETLGQIMEGVCAEQEIADLLVALHEKGETVDEVAGAAAAMRLHMTPIRTQRTGVIDVVGTGGDASGTFNISTAAALVTAAAGQPVAKHGNRRFTSKSGSADVLAELGVNIEADVAHVESCLEELGICFCFAPLLHQAMKHVAPVRKMIATPTIFNILGPLANPARAPYQLLGVGQPRLRPLLSQALAMLGTRRVLVVHGADGLDEVTVGDRTDVTEACGGQLKEFAWTPGDFGLAASSRETMLVETPAESAAVIRRILAGEKGPARDVVVANAAAALWTADPSESLPDCAGRAAEAIDSGASSELLAHLVERSRAC